MAKAKETGAASAALTLEQLKSLNLEHLGAIVNAEGGTIYVPGEVSAPLLAAGLVEIDSSNVNENGHILTRATPAGAEHLIAFSEDTGSTAGAGAAPAVKPTFVIDDAVPLPAGRAKLTRAPRASIYPFDALGIADGAPFGQSFFVPDSADKPNAAKALASTVSSANARYAEEVPGETVKNRKGNDVPKTRQLRRFIVRPVEENGVKGARVWRVAVE